MTMVKPSEVPLGVAIANVKKPMGIILEELEEDDPSAGVVSRAR